MNANPTVSYTPLYDPTTERTPWVPPLDMALATALDKEAGR